MASRKNLLGRNEIKDRVEKAGQDMKEKEDLLNNNVEDIETIRKTLEKLEGGTSEGYEQVEDAIKSAEDVTTESFGREDMELEEVQSESQEFGKEIQESQRSSESDLAKISNASSEFKTKEPDKDFLHAKDEALRDIDLLKEQDEREHRARENSDAIQEKLRLRVQKNRGR